MVLFFKTMEASVLHIILYQLIKFEAPGYFNFNDILITSFQWVKVASKKKYFFKFSLS